MIVSRNDLSIYEAKTLSHLEIVFIFFYQCLLQFAKHTRRDFDLWCNAWDFQCTTGKFVGWHIAKTCLCLKSHHLSIAKTIQRCPEKLTSFWPVGILLFRNIKLLTKSLRCRCMYKLDNITYSKASEYICTLL